MSRIAIMKTDQTIDRDSERRCPNCGGSSLRFMHKFSITRRTRDDLYCDCNMTDEGSDVAAIKESSETEIHIETGSLDEDLRLIVEVREIEDTITDADHISVLCRDCYAEMDTGCWDHSIDSEQRNDDDEWFVQCVHCGQDVAFDWADETNTRARIKHPEKTEGETDNEDNR